MASQPHTLLILSTVLLALSLALTALSITIILNTKTYVNSPRSPC